jgi:hypothetical protein
MAGTRSGWLILGFLACDVFNDASNLWVSIRGILCDGSSFQFFECRSDTSTWSKSMRVPGVDPQPLCPADLAISIKRSTHPHSSLFFSRSFLHAVPNYLVCEY